MLKPVGSCGVREMGCGVRGTGCGYLTAIGHAKVAAVRHRTNYKLTGGRLKLFHFNRDTARKKNVLGAWEASLKRVEAVAFENGLLANVVSQRSPSSAAQR